MLLTQPSLQNASKAPKRGTVPSTRNLVICSIFHHILFFRANNFQQCSGHRFLGSTLKQHVLKKHFGIFMGNTWKYCQHFYYRRACSKCGIYLEHINHHYRCEKDDQPVDLVFVAPFFFETKPLISGPKPMSKKQLPCYRRTFAARLRGNASRRS